MQGTPFGRYLLIDQLGRGGMGEVWRAHDTQVDRVVAIKMLLPHFAKDGKFEQRFRREARAAARLENAHVVPIYDVGEIDDRLYVAMRLINGRDLQTMLDAGPLPPRRVVAIIEQVAKALHAAHRVGLVHRDIKPSNILIDEDDFAYLIDFGIARAAGEAGLTSTGATIGTWSYMAPERFTTGDVAPSSDIYALACVLYQGLTGQVPFPTVGLEQIAVAHMAAPPPQPSTQRSGIPAALDAVIATGLAKEPSQRYATTTALATAARDAVTSPTPLVPAPTPRAPSGAPARPGPPARPVPFAAPRAGSRPNSGSVHPAVRRNPAVSRSQPKPPAPTPPQRWQRKALIVVAAVLAATIMIVVAIGLFAIAKALYNANARPAASSFSSLAPLC